MKRYSLSFAFCLILGSQVSANQPVQNAFKQQKMIITSSIVELLQQPGSVIDQVVTTTGSVDPSSRSSQIFFSEPVVAYKKNGDWIYVRAPQQEAFTAEKGWICASGWIRARQAWAVKDFPRYNVSVKSTWATIYKLPDEKSEKWIKVCAGTKLKGYKRSDDRKWILLRLPYDKIGAIKAEDVCIIKVKKDEKPVENNVQVCKQEKAPVEQIEQKVSNTVAPLRHSIVKTALHFIGTPYALGGCCAIPPGRTKKRTGIDCSGLIKVAYNANGLDIPRTSHAQFLKSDKISEDILAQLKPADLIFSASQKNPQKISHVMMYIGNGDLIESTSGVGKVRVISVSRRLGKPLETVRYGDKLRHSVYYFGSLLDKRGLDITTTGSTNQFAAIKTLPSKKFVSKKRNKNRKLSSNIQSKKKRKGIKKLQANRKLHKKALIRVS